MVSFIDGDFPSRLQVCAEIAQPSLPGASVHAIRELVWAPAAGEVRWLEQGTGHSTGALP